MGYSRGRRYREREVREIITAYADVLEDRDTDRRGIQAVIAIADLKRAWRFLNAQERRLLLAHGVMGLSTREAAPVLSKSPQWIAKYYAQAITRLTDLMNGGT